MPIYIYIFLPYSFAGMTEQLRTQNELRVQLSAKKITTEPADVLPVRILDQFFEQHGVHSVAFIPRDRAKSITPEDGEACV